MITRTSTAAVDRTGHAATHITATGSVSVRNRLAQPGRLGIIAVLGWALAGAGAGAAAAATAPSLGTAGTFGIVSSTFTNSNTGPQTIINGDVCYTTRPVTPPMTITGTTVTVCSPSTGESQGLALANLLGEPCTSLGDGAVALDSIVVGSNPPGVIPPGCYSSGGAMSITVSTSVTLLGAGVYIFRPGGALNTGANSSVLMENGACASDVFWAPVGAATLGANAALALAPTFSGTIIADAGITIGHFANLTGRALAFGGTVTTDANTITVPTCSGVGGNGERPDNKSVPTLSGWVMVVLSSLLAMAGLVALRRRSAVRKIAAKD